MTQNSAKNKVRHVMVSMEHAGRRIDNFLTSQLKGIPKARLYQMLRKGEVRVNSARIRQDHRLQAGDDVRIPPLHSVDEKTVNKPPRFLLQFLENNILYEDNALLALNKPAGIVVHGGSGQQYGVIETLRILKPNAPYLELVHRLDKDTSGCLLIAKQHNVLRALHEKLRSGKITKYYLALLKNHFEKEQIEVCLPLQRDKLRAGERIVRVHDDGKQAKTVFCKKKSYPGAGLVRVQLMTGRTHQIRVHAAYIGHPVAGDAKYGDRNFNKLMKKAGLKRMFLHAETVEFFSPYNTGRKIKIKAPLADDLALFLRSL